MPVEHAHEILLTDIRVVGQRRALNDSKIAELAASIAIQGLLVPITVMRDGRLVAGQHRVAACRRLGWESVPCEYFSGDDALAELAEIDENFARVDLTVIERGDALLRREEILTALGLRAPSHRPPAKGDTVQGGEEKGETVSPFPPQQLKTTAQIAAEAGMTERSVQQHKQIARNILPSVKEVLRTAPIGNSTRRLLAIARQPAEVQQQYAAALARGDEAAIDRLADACAPELAPPVHGQERVSGLHITADVKQAAAAICEHFSAAWCRELARLLVSART